MAKDFGHTLKQITIGSDSGAAKGILGRVGLGRIRHLNTGLLWILHYAAQKIFRSIKEHGPENRADLGTKDLAETEMRKHCEKIGVEEIAGRHQLALRAGGEVSNGLSGYGAEDHEVNQVSIDSIDWIDAELRSQLDWRNAVVKSDVSGPATPSGEAGLEDERSTPASTGD